MTIRKLEIALTISTLLAVSGLVSAVTLSITVQQLANKVEALQAKEKLTGTYKGSEPPFPCDATTVGGIWLDTSVSGEYHYKVCLRSVESTGWKELDWGR